MPDLSEWDKLNALAMQHREGWRVFHDDKHGEIRYEIAPLPAGCVAMRMKAAYRCGDNHGVSIPWRLYPSRDEGLRAVLEQANRHFSYPVFGSSSEQKQAQKRMLALLKGMAPRFKEPDPESVQEAKPIRTQVERVETKREKPVQKELF